MISEEEKIMTRRELREHVFLMLFRRDFYDSLDELKDQAQLYLDEAETPIDDSEKEYLKNKVNAIYELVTSLDEKINEVAKGWKTKRMSKVDLTIIRLALYEMQYDEDVPEKVAINEGVELAKKFGGDDSPSFVNGILARLVRQGQ